MGAVYGAGRMVAPLVVDLIGFPFAIAAMWWWAPDGLPALFAALVGGMAVVAALHVAYVAWGPWTRVHVPASVSAAAASGTANVAPARRGLGTEAPGSP
jgi:hypothetical protein